MSGLWFFCSAVCLHADWMLQTMTGGKKAIKALYDGVRSEAWPHQAHVNSPSFATISRRFDWLHHFIVWLNLNVALRFPHFKAWGLFSGYTGKQPESGCWHLHTRKNAHNTADRYMTFTPWHTNTCCIHLGRGQWSLKTKGRICAPPWVGVCVCSTTL